MSDPSGYATLLGRKDLLPPGNCGICHRSDIEPIDTEDSFIDVKLYIEYFGQVYICVFCAADIAHLINWKSPQDYDNINELLEKVNVQVKERDETIEAMQNELSALRSAIQYIAPDNDSNVSGGVDSGSQESREESQDNYEIIDFTESGTEDNDSEPDQSGESSRPVVTKVVKLSDGAANPIGNL